MILWFVFKPGIIPENVLRVQGYLVHVYKTMQYRTMFNINSQI